MKLRLRHKIIGLATCAALLPMIIVAALTLAERTWLCKMVGNRLDRLTRDNIKHLTRVVYDICQYTDTLMEYQLEHAEQVAEETVGGPGSVGFASDMIHWEAVNWLSKERSSVQLPRMEFSSRTHESSEEERGITELLEKVGGVPGIVIAVFQRMNNRGDLLLLQRSPPGGDGRMRPGAYLPAVDPDGKPNTVVAHTLEGESFKEYIDGLGTSALALCTPLSDGAGRVVGLVAIGIRPDEMRALRDTILRAKVGQSGYVWVYGARGDRRGRVVLAQEDKYVGENHWDLKDVDGKLITQAIVTKALKLKPGEVGFEAFRWKSQPQGDKTGIMGMGSDDSTEIREKIAAFTYFEPWDWVIGTSIYEDEFHDMRRDIGARFTQLSILEIIGGLVILAIIVVLAVYMGRKIALPISQITIIAEEIARGDLIAAANSCPCLQAQVSGSPDAEAVCKIDHHGLGGTSGDETGQLLTAIHTMTDHLYSLLSQVRRSGLQVSASTARIAASAHQLEASVTRQATSTGEVSATAKQISATSRELVNTMGELTSVASETAALAGDGRSRLNAMGQAMQQLLEATGSISQKLSVISEKAHNINHFVTTITKVADQTNLLSLNAAIEAEKAGEYGLGFSVVAREIRRLADQTAVATLDIEQMVREMQSSVSAGVMEMDKFAGQVQSGADMVQRVSDHLEKIIADVQSLTTRFEAVNEGMHSQSIGAGQISAAMAELSDTARQASESLREFNVATDQLNDAVVGLEGEVSRFKVEA